MINVDAPGSTSANLRSLGHVRCPRPIFPLDDDVSFAPRVELYSRPRYGVLPATRAPVPWRHIGEDPRDRGGRPVRRDARGRLEQGAPSGRLGPHPRRGRHRGGARSATAARSPTSTSSAPRSPSSSRSIAGRRPSNPSGRQRDPPPEHLLARPRRDAHPHDQRDRHRAVGPVRAGDRAAGRPAARRALPRSGAAVRLDPDARAGSAGRRARAAGRPGLPRVQDRLGPVRPGERRGWTRRSSRARARRSGRTSR